MVYRLDYGYREDLLLEYRGKVNFEELMEAFKAQWKGFDRKLDVVATASGTTVLFSITRTYFGRGAAVASIIAEAVSKTDCLVTIHARAELRSLDSAAIKIIDQITQFIKDECSALVQVQEEAQLSSLRTKTANKPSATDLGYDKMEEEPGLPTVEAQGGAKTCPICKDQIKPSEETASCPFCHVQAHKGDLLEWIHVKGSCPSCGSELRDDQVRDHTPLKQGKTH
jgi:endogenous inhibitor of DNA gyrase (YacG/DUF329 family)